MTTRTIYCKFISDSTNKIIRYTSKQINYTKLLPIVKLVPSTLNVALLHFLKGLTTLVLVPRPVTSAINVPTVSSALDTTSEDERNSSVATMSFFDSQSDLLAMVLNVFLFLIQILSRHIFPPLFVWGFIQEILHLMKMRSYFHSNTKYTDKSKNEQVCKSILLVNELCKLHNLYYRKLLK